MEWSTLGSSVFLFVIWWVLSIQGLGSKELRGTASLMLSPLVLPPLIYEKSLFPPAKFAKSNFQLIWRSQQQAQRA